ncbi:MAG: histidinol dehydrogenase, partial [Pseudomonadales bacterium]
MSVVIKQLDYSESDFQSELDKALAWDSISDQSVQESVSTIIADVRSRGDKAVVEWTNKLDGLSVDKVSALEISKDELQESLKKI